MSEAFDFRLRFTVGHGRKLQVEAAEVLLHEDPQTVVTMRAVRGGPAIKDADALVVIGTSYSSEHEAESEGWAWKNRLSRAFAVSYIGADFGDDTASSGVSEYMRENVLATTGRTVLNDVHGLMIYPSNVKPLLAGGSASLTVGAPVERFLAAVSSVNNKPMNDREHLAAAIYASAQALVGSSEATFVTLMMALEVLIDQQPRSPRVLALTETLAQAVEESDLSDSEKASVAGTLNWLRVESITSAGRRLVQAHAGPTYGGKSADAFFVRCYAIRSALVHGHQDRLPAAEVGSLAGHLSLLVGDLLAIGSSSTI